MYASEWIFGLFASVIPTDQMHLFFDQFFKNRWLFFYQLVLSLLKQHATLISTEEDFYAFMHAIKTQSYRDAGLENLQTDKNLVTSEKRREMTSTEIQNEFDPSDLNEFGYDDPDFDFEGLEGGKEVLETQNHQ